MTFAHPWLLLLLVVPLVLLVKGWRYLGHQVAVPVDHSTVAIDPVTRRRRSRRLFWLRLAASLPAGALAVIIAILAGPRQWGLPQEKRVMTNIEFLVDVSGSMTSPFGEGNRYDGAMAAVLGFIDQRPGDAFGLIVFGDSILEWVPLTSDPSALKAAPEFLSPMRLPRWFSGGTSIGMALEHTLKVMAAREEGDRMIVLVTDGYSGDLSGGNDERIARKLKDAGIQVFCIHVDSSAPPAEVELISRMTDGAVFAAGDPNALTQVFQRIDAMKKTRMEQVSAEAQDNFPPYCVAGA
jgi:Ca-activated chloride channel homolog